jgi:phosphoglycolate phosphatase-like HAD superfamily hydrolase
MIGDTEADIIAAHSHHVPAIAVLSGIRNQAQLEKHEPKQIVANLVSAIDEIINV